MWDASSERGAVGSKADIGCIPNLFGHVYTTRFITDETKLNIMSFLGSSPLVEDLSWA